MRRHFSLLPTIAFLALAALAMEILLQLRVLGDIEAHAHLASLSGRDGLWPSNFGLYVLARLLAYPRSDIDRLSYVIVGILTAAVLAKLIVTRRLLLAEWALPSSPRSAAAATLATAGLLVAFSLPPNFDQFYLGQFPPNVWHNSTTIALMPLAILLFHCSCRFLRAPSFKLGLGTALLCVANVVIKPSFILPFVMVFPLLALWKFRLSRPLLGAAGISLLCVILLAIQTYYTYSNAPLLAQFYGARYQVSYDPEQIQISFFTVWRNFSGNLPLSLLCSIAFPLSYLLLFFRRAIRDDLVLYAWALFAAALLLTCALMETGLRKFHGNFFWQTIIANYLLFTATLIGLFRPQLPERPPLSHAAIRRGAVLAVFGLHLLAGLYYFQRILTTGEFR